MPLGLDVPDWCRVRRGGGPLLLVAPHGGARSSARGDRAVKVNDLHTAELAEELALALDAGLIANPVLDRNELDLNRISQVARAAPWFPALLEELVAEILARHERAEVVFLHGWNTVQPKCDIGIGHRLRAPADAAAHAGALTASAAYVTSRLAALRDACAAAGIAAPLGERYPARHANNVLQLFRRNATGSVAPRLRDWAAAGRVEAVQLELAAPLRWPGPLRAAFSAALREAFAGTPTASADCPPYEASAAIDIAPSAMTLQVYDAASGIGLLARVDPGGDGVSGRLLLFLGTTQVALFTGDDRDCTRLSAGGPHFTLEPNGLRLRFDGWALCAADGALYVDLEQAFAASHLLGVDVDVTFSRRRDDFGRVRGTVTLDGVQQGIDAAGFAPPSGVFTAADSGWRSHLTLRAALPGDAAIALRQRVPGGALLHAYGDAALAARPVRSLAVTFDGEPYTPRRIVVGNPGDALVAETLARMAILRPLPGGRRSRVTFGVARVERGGASGFGFYEYARVVD